MCFALQRRALFRHRHCQKYPKVLRSSRVLSILAWTCASRHNAVHCFMSHLASWFRTCRFTEPTFRLSGATNHRKKHSVSRLSYLFTHLLLLSSVLFSSDSFHHCFSSPNLRSFTSKLPSAVINHIIMLISHSTFNPTISLRGRLCGYQVYQLPYSYCIPLHVHYIPMICSVSPHDCGQISIGASDHAFLRLGIADDLQTSERAPLAKTSSGCLCNRKAKLNSYVYKYNKYDVL